MTRRLPALLALAAILAAPALAGCLESGSAASQGPLPLDPLSAEERARAIGIATADPDVAALLAEGRHRVLAAFLRTDKPAILAGDTTRFAEVHAYRYASDDTLRVVVDLTRASVVRATTEAFQPRLATEEVAEAKAVIASASARDPASFEILAMLWSGPDPAHACATHRCVEAWFLVDGVMTDEPRAYVDLSTLAIVEPEVGA